MQTSTGHPQRDAIRAHRATELVREILTVTADFEQHLGTELGVNPTDLKAMEHLMADGPLSPTELAHRLGVTTAAATSVVDRLTALGHVSRQANPADRRGVLVVPSPASVGRAMATLLPMISAVDAAIGEFDDAEQAVITRYLERVVAVYSSHVPPAGEADVARAGATR